MTKKSIKLEFKNFIKGLITEASPINFPPEASADEENFQLNRDGTRDRRFGLGYETGNELRDLPISLDDFIAADPVLFEWRNVNGYSGRNFLVIQTGIVLTFFDLKQNPMSSDGYRGIMLLPEIPPGTKCSMAAISGHLVVVADIASIYIVKYTGTEFISTLQKLLVRDLWGIEEEVGLEGDDKKRPTSLSTAHAYNLNNQSWGIPRKDKDGMLRDPIPIYVSASGPTTGSAAVTSVITAPYTGSTPASGSGVSHDESGSQGGSE